MGVSLVPLSSQCHVKSTWSSSRGEITRIACSGALTLGTLVFNKPFTATDCLLHLHHHARPPKLVLQQGQCMPLALVSHVPMAPIHGHHSMSCGDYKLQSLIQLSGQSMVVIEGTLMNYEFLPLPRMAMPSSIMLWSPRRCLRSCTLWDEIHSIVILSMWCSFCAATQSITCKFTHMWVACTWTAVSSTCLCILFVGLSHCWVMASALPGLPVVTPSRMDFTASAFSFDATCLRASATALSLPFWYLMLNVNAVSNSTQWCQVVSKLGVVKI